MTRLDIARTRLQDLARAMVRYDTGASHQGARELWPVSLFAAIAPPGVFSPSQP